ncbi:phosphoserine phosphatase SerB [Georgenia wangjunii]|uniref:phosphoserine phosphatase SerB n=1 Tax=Georgenia wangjunii TaxID=3117730 RepID=UPI002F26D789
MRALRIGTVWPLDDDGAAPAVEAEALRALVVRVAATHGWGLGAAEPTGGTGWAGLTWLGEVSDDAAAPPGTAAGHAPAVTTLRAAAATLGADVAVTTGPLASEGPALVVTDVDSTFVDAEAIDLLAARAGALDAVAALTERAMRGELDFAESLRERVATLAGLPGAVLDEVRAHMALMPGSRELVAALHARGTPIGLVSGGFAELVVPLAAELGIDLVRANHLELGPSRELTGRTRAEVVDARVKARTLREWARATGADPARVVAVGDGANDLDMIAAAGIGIAFCAKPLVRERADATVSFPRLDAVLGLLGLGAPR